jgi:hypothetical protein
MKNSLNLAVAQPTGEILNRRIIKSKGASSPFAFSTTEPAQYYPEDYKIRKLKMAQNSKFFSLT